jgi:hypothetical protein
MRRKDYSEDNDSQENTNSQEKYAATGESEYSREHAIPVDEDEVLSERHYTFDGLNQLGKRQLRAREPRSGPVSAEPEARSQRSDETIKADVKAAIYRRTVVDACGIEVLVKRGLVTLLGVVNYPDEIKMAKETIEQVPGVRYIRNEIRARSSEASRPNPRGLIDNITGMN